MSEIKQIAPTLIAPNQTLQAGDLQTTWIDNPRGIRERTYGPGLAPQGVLPHDHGQGRGVTLDRPILSLSFGPYAPPGASVGDVTIGIPIYAATSGTDFAETPKLLASSHILLVGGIVHIRASVFCLSVGSGDRSFALTVSIRPLPDAGVSRPDARAGVAVEKTFSTSAIGAVPLRQEFEFDREALSALGNPAIDREAEICIWVSGAVTAGTEHRLCSLLVVPGDPPTSMSLTTEPLTYAAAPVISPIEIHPGTKLVTPLMDKARARLNADTVGVLGAAPGLTADAQTPDTARGWVQRIRGPHQHRGKAHREHGELAPDGACVRYGGWTQTYITDAGDDSVTGEMNTLSYRGQFIRDSGSPVIFEGRLSIPDGLGRLIMRFALIPTATPGVELCRLKVFALLFKELNASGGNNLITGMGSSGTFTSIEKYENFLTCETLPIDSAAYQPNASRGPLRLWTQAALLSGSNVPGDVDVINAYRISEEVRMSISAPETADYRLQVFFELEVGVPGGGTFASNARVQWIAVYPDYGF